MAVTVVEATVVTAVAMAATVAIVAATMEATMGMAKGIQAMPVPETRTPVAVVPMQKRVTIMVST
ncbi:UNVERIFIED_ORG: hypothetical protein J2W87_005277 [Pseudomonas putida]|nr:hypothetical protein [Pseudomonas putida]